MNTYERVLVQPTATILDVIEIIDQGAIQIALVVDEDKRLVGTVTDGDVRRGLLRGINLNDQVSEILNPTPTTAHSTDSVDTVLAIMKLKHLHHIPIVDDAGRVVRIETLDNLLQSPEQENWVLIMAGGLGTRLRPLTDDCPKPLLKVGTRPLLETILTNFMNHGFRKFYLSVNYKADMIEDYFRDGAELGAEIRYIHEQQRMGTAGALSLLPEKPKQPIVVMNGDLLTKVNFQQLLDFHAEHKAEATMCVREYSYQIPYGVVSIDHQRLVEIQEKPMSSCFVNAGIYVLNPDVLDLIPKHSFFDMPELFAKLLELKCETAVFPIREYWKDIGRIDDYDAANGEYAEVFG